MVAENYYFLIIVIYVDRRVIKSLNVFSNFQESFFLSDMM